MRVSSAALVAVAVTLLLPAGAGATIRQVNGATGSDSSNCAVAVCKTIQYATDQSNAGDTIEIAAGTYEETVETFTSVEWVGEGTDATIVHGAAGGVTTGHPAFYLKGGGSLNSLRAEGGEGGTSGVPPFTTGEPGGPAILFEPNGIDQDELEMDEVEAVGGVGGAGSILGSGTGGTGLLAQASEGGKALSAVALIAAPGPGGLFGTAPAAAVLGSAMSAKFDESEFESGEGISSGFRVAEGAAATLEDSFVGGDFFGAGAEGADLTVRQSFIFGNVGALSVTPVGEPSAEVRVVDSLVASLGVAAAALTGGGGSSKLVINGSTIYSEKGSGPAVQAEPGTSASLRNTIAFHVPESEPKRDLVAKGGTITAQNSSFSTSIQEEGGTAPAPGSGTNIAGPPGFAGEGPLLATNSPLIDRGDPSIVESGELDLEGAPRSLDGNHDCVVAPDIGAFELQGQSSPCPSAPNVADAVPVVSGFGITNKKFAPKGSSRPHARASLKPAKKGTKFTYSLSEPAKTAILIERKKSGKGRPKFVKVTTLSAQKQSGKQSTSFSGKVKGKPMKPGKYRATITATDSAGQASAPHQLSFTVVSG